MQCKADQHRQTHATRLCTSSPREGPIPTDRRASPKADARPSYVLEHGGDGDADDLVGEEEAVVLGEEQADAGVEALEEEGADVCVG